jgi:uncharacterized protein YajQ (UPF0234 family)
MPSFDIISNADLHEITNAVDQANREVSTRFDFKNTDSNFMLSDETIHLTTETKFQLQQMQEILNSKLAKRNVDIHFLKYKDPETNLSQARQEAQILQGIQQEVAKTITKFIKEKKLKVQTTIQGEQIRVTGKKRDDLQEVIAALRGEDFKIPLQFDNFRD